jgi:hypothetical protein
MEDPSPNKLEWLSKNLASLSAVCLLVSFGVAIWFISSYFAVVDSNLIWILEYPDLAKLTIILFALFVSVSSLYFSYFQQSFFAKRASNRYFLYAMLAIAFVVDFSFNVHHAINSHDGLRAYYIDRSILVVLLGLLFVIFIVNGEEILRLNDAGWMIVAGAIILLFVGQAGRTYGGFIKSASTSYVTASTKREVLSSAKLIAMFSHHVALYWHGRVVLLPTADIIQLDMGPAPPPLEE